MPVRKKKPGSETRKLVAVTWRYPGLTEWHTETIEITGYSTTGGILTLFCAGAAIRAFASGYWADVTLIGEEPVPARIEDRLSAESLREEGPSTIP